jgi:alpha-amylase
MGMQRMAIYVIWFLLATCGATRALGAGAPTAWAAEDQVFYKIFVRSFADSNGDRIGDFLGIEQHLDYLQKLGVTSLLLTPIVPSKFYHNYFASQFDGVDPSFGDLAAFQHLVRAVHSRRMKIYLDQEIQYVSSEHAWWQSVGHPQSPFAQYLLFSGPDNTKPEAGFSFKTYDGQSANLAIVNLKLPAVRRYFEAVFAAWLDPGHNGDFSAGVDGFRIDHMMDDLDHKGRLTNLVADFWAPLLASARTVNPRMLSIAEQADWQQFGDDLQRRGGIDLVYAFPLRAALVSLNRDAVAAAIEATVAKTAPGKGQLIFLENHDTIRFASEVRSDARKERLGAALNVLLKGSPLLYYGQELGMLGRQMKDTGTDGNDIPVREAFRWNRSVDAPGSALWYRGTGIWWDKHYAKNNDGISVEEEQDRPDSLLEYYRKLIALRRSHPELQQGDQSVIPTKEAGVLVVDRELGSAESLIVCNFAATRKSVEITTNELKGLGRRTLQRDPLTQQAPAAPDVPTIRVDLPAYGVRVLPIVWGRPLN